MNNIIKERNLLKLIDPMNTISSCLYHIVKRNLNDMDMELFSAHETQIFMAGIASTFIMDVSDLLSCLFKNDRDYFLDLIYKSVKQMLNDTKMEEDND